MHVLGAGLVAQLEKDLLAMRATRVRLLGWEDHPGEVNDTPLQYSCLENLMDRGAWQATVHGVTRVIHNLATKPPPPLEKSSQHSLREEAVSLLDRQCVGTFKR